MLKLLHVPYLFYPDPPGGTEIYVEALAHALNRRGVRNEIAAPGSVNALYEAQGLTVHRFAVSGATRERHVIYGEGDADAARAFGAILDAVKPDVAHFHAYSPAVGLHTAREATRRKIPVVFTYHSATASCARGGLMRWGNEPCDGVLDVPLCAACTLQGLGAPRMVAEQLVHAPAGLTRFAAKRQGGMWTALEMRALIAKRSETFLQFLDQTERIVVMADWTRALLARNGIRSAQLVTSRHGVPFDEFVPRRAPRTPSNPLRIVALGRLDPVKGMPIVLEAILGLPDANVRLDLYGIVQEGADSGHASRLQQQCAGDARIRLLPPVPHAELPQLLAQYDLLAVPSVWFETGPLVVLEAFAAGVPVIGSNLGGTAENVRAGVDGLLVKPGDVCAWRDALAALVRDPAQVEQLRAGVRPPRPMNAAAQEMYDLYREVLDARHTSLEPTLLADEQA